MNLRVPAGVYVNGQPMGGRFVSRDALPDLIARADGDGPEILLGFIYEHLDKSTLAHEWLERRFQDDPRRYASRTAKAENERLAWERVAAEADSSMLPLDEQELAAEWELSFDYNGETRDKDFDLNIRLARTDHQPFNLTDAQNALRDVMRTAMVPPGYRMAVIQWRRPQRGTTGWRSGDVSDLEAFSSPMYVHHDDEHSVNVHPSGGGKDTHTWDFGRTFRLGSVRPH